LGIALHHLDLAAAHCDLVVVLFRGRMVAAGAVEDVLVPQVIDPVYAVRTTVLPDPRTGRPVLTFTAARDPGGLGPFSPLERDPRVRQPDRRPK
jgi:hypothetical protein